MLGKMCLDGFVGVLFEGIISQTCLKGRLGNPTQVKLKTMGFTQFLQPRIVIVAENINNRNNRVMAMTLITTTMTTIANSLATIAMLTIRA